VPIDATSAQKAQIISDFKKALADNNVVVPMATTDLFREPIFRDGAFTSNDPKVRAFAIQKTMNAMDLGAEFGAKTYVFWGGREGTETDAGKSALDAGKWFRDALNFLCEYNIEQSYGYRFALEPKPNEPRGDIYLPTVGSALGFIATLDHHEMVGVNPEVAHEQMAGLNFMHAIAQAWDAGKLFHIDLNDQKIGRYDQDFRFGSESIKQAFYIVKFLEDVGYHGSRHFDAHAYRSSDLADVKEFAKGCMRTYLILKEKAEKFNADTEIQALLAQITADDGSMTQYIGGKYSSEKAKALKAHSFNRAEIAAKGQPYEKLDQLVFELLMGVR
jgi:xylose isomerase